MNRPLLRSALLKDLNKIQKEIKKQTAREPEVIELPFIEAKKLQDFLNEVITLQPFVLDDEFLTPNQASELAGVSRPIIMQMLENDLLKAHKVNTHWKISKQSLLKFIERREKAHSAIQAMDEDGFSLD